MDVFNVNVKIQIGVTDELFKLLQPVVSSLNKPQVENEKPALEDKKPKSGNGKKAEEDKKPQVENEKQITRAEENSEVKEEQPAEQAEESSEEVAEVKEETAETKEYTEVDVRAAMDATRKRIEGEDYKTNTESEGRKNWHRKLTAWFKNTAAVLGADKPSELPDSASRAAFIASCERVTIENNELIENAPL